MKKNMCIENDTIEKRDDGEISRVFSSIFFLISGVVFEKKKLKKIKAVST